LEKKGIGLKMVLIATSNQTIFVVILSLAKNLSFKANEILNEVYMAVEKCGGWRPNSAAPHA
jgi:hypothetical protein